MEMVIRAMQGWSFVEASVYLVLQGMAKGREDDGVKMLYLG